MLQEYLFDSQEQLLEALLKRCLELLSEALEQRPRCTLLASGGRTPEALYRALSQQPLPWSRVDVALVDERWVAPSDAASNERFLRASLLQFDAASAVFTAMKNAAATAAEGLAACEAAYRQLPKPFDLTLLGMGPDAHTASLFPAAEGLEAALDTDGEALCAAIQARPSAVTGAFTERITLSLQGLLQSRRLLLIITGEEKLQVYRRALDCVDFSEMPVAAVLQQSQVPVEVYWAP